MAEEKNIPNPEEAKRLAQNLEAAGERLADLREDAILSNAAFSDMVKNISEAARNGDEYASAMKNSASAVKGIQNEARLIAKLDKDSLKTAKSLETAAKAQKKLKGKIAELDSQIKVLSEARVTASSKERIALNKTVKELSNAKDEASRLASSFQEVAEAADEINSKTNFFDKMANFVEDIPGMSKVFGEFKNAAEAARAAAAEGGNAMKAGAKELGGVVVKMAATFAIGKIAKGFRRTNEVLVDLERNMNLSREQAIALDKRFVALGSSTLSLTGKDMLKAQKALSDQFGIQADLSDDTLVTMGALTKKMGLSAEEAGTLAQFAAGTGKDLKEVTENMIGQVTIQNLNNKSAIRYQDIMKDVSESSAATQLSNSKFPGGIAKAAFQARKLGMSFDQLNSAASALLDFESSIGAEMEAELLLGRDLNLDAARQAALRGDDAALAAELAKNIGTAADFTNMNRIEQEALAKAMGMSREEVAETLMKQEAIKNLGGDITKSLDEEVKKQYDKAMLLKDEEARARELARISKEAGAKEIVDQLKLKTEAEAREELQQQMVESVSALGDPLKTIADAFSSISEYSGTILAGMTALGSVLFFKRVSGLVKIFKNVTGQVKNLKSAFGFGGKKAAQKGAEKVATKTAGKSLAKQGAKLGAKGILKRIPILGSLMGVGFAVDRAIKGDWAGAAMEVGSAGLGLLDLVAPGLGTGLSLAADAGIAARDLKRAGTVTPTADAEMNVSDFVIKPLGEDTITMAGGTKLGGNVEELLKELIGIVKQGGNVYMDGSKVGSTLALSARLSN
mgnify:CR=1 FL=1